MESKWKSGNIGLEVRMIGRRRGKQERKTGEDECGGRLRSRSADRAVGKDLVGGGDRPAGGGAVQDRC